MEFADREITCLDCSQPFTFTAGEQEFYDRKGFREEPKRCRACRDARKSRRTTQLRDGLEESGERGNGNGNGNVRRAKPRVEDDSIGNRAPAPRGREASQGERALFDAVCAQCGERTRVPFRPSGGRPVYCRGCFAATRGVGG
jgi:CxxC-x17-CxxC domain-containing protein